MADTAASILARLKNKAKETGRSNQLCLQLFCQEEFLRRLQHSRYSENLILKGGLFIYALTEFDSRVTVDVDFLLRNIPNTPEKMGVILRDIISVKTDNSFITFEIIKIEQISATKKYAGISATITARIKNTRTAFCIDMGVDDVIFPRYEKRRIPPQLDDFDAPVVNTYSIETAIAEKLDAILSLMEFSSRMKDYYDIMYLSRKFDFDGKTFKTAIEKTFKNRNRAFTTEAFEQFLALGSDVAMRKKWASFLKKVKGENNDFTDVISSMDIFLREPLFAVLQERSFLKMWDAASGRWI